MPYKLVVNFGGKTVERREVDAPRYVIGRSTECDLVIDNLGVSRQHTEIVMEGPSAVVKDMKSNNGTFVNGKRITRYNLNDGDEISIGKFAITFHMETPEEEEGGEGEEAAEAPTEKKGDFTLAIDSRLMEKAQKTSKLKAYMTIQGGDRKKPIVLDKSIFTFGKLATCDYFVGGFFAPSKAAFIFRDDVAFHLIDTGKGKAHLNETPIDSERLKDGDVIRVGGSQKLEFHVGTPQLT